MIKSAIYLLIEKLKKREKQFYTTDDAARLRVGSGKSYIPMKGLFYPELITELFNKKRYITSLEREKYQVFYEDGDFFCVDDFLLKGLYTYCLLDKEHLYVAPVGVIHHSYLVAGLPVVAAGTMDFSNGRLIAVSNNSGHYKPSFKQMIQILPDIYEISCNEDLVFQDYSLFTQDKATTKFINYNVKRLLSFQQWGKCDDVISQEQCKISEHDVQVGEEKAQGAAELTPGYDKCIFGKVDEDIETSLVSNFFSVPKIRR